MSEQLKAELEVIRFEDADVIATSEGNSFQDEENNNADDPE